jgi:cytochrome c peroxidase
MGNAQLGQELTDQEVTYITAFLESLTGTLPQITYPILPAETPATPRPSGEVITK